MITSINDGMVRVSESSSAPLVLLTVYPKDDLNRIAMTVEETKIVIEALKASVAKIESGEAPKYAVVGK